MLTFPQTNPDGTLTYTFVESLKATYPYYEVRLLGGAIVLSGMFLLAYNFYKTAQQHRGAPVAAAIPQPV